MTETQLDIFAEIAPPEVAQHIPADLYRSEYWIPQHEEFIQDHTGFAECTLLAAFTGACWVGGFRMVCHENGRLVHALEIMPGGVIVVPGCRLPVPKDPITSITRPGVLADAAQTLAHAMTGYEDLRLVPLMEALDEYRRREVVRI